ncbi:MAG: hypothetical protein PHV34_05855 [Verrucomicrobiae bacterium]|nr:hypothetical protein [Verrucomicrobiae bacterium]
MWTDGIVDFQAFLALVAGNELDLGVGGALFGEEGEHLVPEQVGMDWLRDLSAPPIMLDDLLHSTGREGSVSPRFEEVLVFRIALQVALEHQAEIGREKDVPVFASLALIDEDFAGVQIDIFYPDADQFSDSPFRQSSTFRLQPFK